MPEVLRCDELAAGALAGLLARFGLDVQRVAPGESIPGSYWGGSEAGLVGTRLLVRGDTPVHSALHEACHFVCMDPGRRAVLHTDAGGDDLEEAAVCYLQLLLADELPGFGQARAFADMDAWGYSFRLGSARAWFQGDAGDARDWLRQRAIIDEGGWPTGRCRG